MKLSEYDQFVRDSDSTKTNKSRETNGQGERLRIARYGLASEVGALAKVLKNKVLHHSTEQWDTRNTEIVEEIGDCLWYVTLLSQMEEDGGLVAVVAADIEALTEKIEEKVEFKAALKVGAYEKFNSQYPSVLEAAGDALLDSYQQLAFLTARTEGRAFLDICITRLLVYTTSVMSRQFPESEYQLSDDLLNYSSNQTLGVLLWHLCAVATLYDIKMSEVANDNQKKIRSIAPLPIPKPTELFDEDMPSHERFPRQFSVTYISVSRDRLQMFYRGRPLGDELDDNSEMDDGYRFHDALHLANVAILGWSPVLRSLMKLKRKSRPNADRAQDGARARIVEEAIVKAVHSEAIRVAQLEGLTEEQAKTTLFSETSQISYDFLKLIMTFAEGLEVAKCEPWEWRRAFVAGHYLLRHLQDEKQGTVTVDLEARSVTFSKLAVPDYHGPVLDSTIEVFEAPRMLYSKLKQSDRKRTEKIAILNILGLQPSEEHLDNVEVSYAEDGRISVKADGKPQDRIWSHSIIGFRTKWSKVGRRWFCVAMAIGAPN